MINLNLSYSFINPTGRAKEKLLLSKLVSILTPWKQIPNIKEGISFENLLIFWATISNIEVPYKNSVRKEMTKLKGLQDFNSNYSSKKSPNSGLSAYQSEFEDLAWKSKYKYGYFNKQGTVVFSSRDKTKMAKEFIAFATSRREFINQRKKEKAIGRIETIKNEFNHVPSINLKSKKRASVDLTENVPVFENLLTKGKEYQEKSKILMFTYRNDQTEYWE